MSFTKLSYVRTLEGGSFKINGVGLPSKWPHSLFQASYSTSYEWDIIESTPEYIIIDVPETARDLLSKFTINGPADSGYTYLYQNASCDSGLNLTYIEQGNDIIMNITKPSGMSITKIKIISKINPEIVYNIETFVSTSSTNVVFKYGLNSGAFFVRAFKDVEYCGGWEQLNKIVEIDMSSLSFNLTQIGREGGLFRVDGKLSEAAEIHVNGHVGEVSHQSGNQTWFSIPSFDL